MGVVRLLCITILCVSLVAALDCSGNGWKNSHGDCVCTSGFDLSDCSRQFSLDPMCPAPRAASEKKDDRFPILDAQVSLISFYHNTLKLSIVSEVVPNRQYNDIVFLNSTASPVNGACKLSATATDSSLWAQYGQLNHTTQDYCRDRFELTMPWTNWQDCGFYQSAAESGLDSLDWVYRATFVISYTDYLGQPFDIPESTYKPQLYRHSTVAYKVWVRFLKKVDVSSILQISVNNTVSLMAAITKYDFNPDNQILTFGISTVVLWPNMYLRGTVTLSIDTPNPAFYITNSNMPYALSPAAETYENDQSCKKGENNCLQYFEFQLQLNQGFCDFNGDFILSGIVATCRDDPVNSPCTNATQEAHIIITHSDVCGSVTAYPTVSGRLMSYDGEDDATKAPMTEFTLGYRGYFEVDMDSQANDFNLTWIDIWIFADQDLTLPQASADPSDYAITKTQWLYRDGALQTANFWRSDDTQFWDFAYDHDSDPAEPTGPCDLQVHDLTRNSNTQVVFTPRFNFRFDARIFHIPLFGPNTKKAYTLRARGKITYAGNEYQSTRAEEIVDFVWKSDNAGFDGSVHFGVAQASTSAVNTTPSSALLGSLVPVAGIALVVVAVAVIAAVVVVKRKKTSSFATLN